ncbi:MAG TPA: patatin-like phospholipase family protein [Paucimonas sp.]|nr:patatin-like phospholipase family protein [Paucimonas sp.]
MNALDFRAGPQALARLREHGLRAQDIAAIPAAAGGPKGLIFQALDQWLFGQWLPTAPRERSLIGASIGAWRMAAACHADSGAAFERLGALYCEQRYPRKPSPRLVTEYIVRMLADFIDGHEHEILGHPSYRLQLLAVRGRRLLAAPDGRFSALAGFTLATLDNMASRARLARHMERVVVADQRAPAAWLKTRFDAFETHFAPLERSNLAPALLASGTLPFVMEAVRDIPHAPAGTYWDGGLIDYHLALPYSRLADDAAGADSNIVLYPHFNAHIVPGWLDKPLPWRRASRGENRGWLNNVLLISPSPAFLCTLPRGKLPDRKDFHFHGLDHDARIRDWRLAIAAGRRLRDEFAAFVERPDLGRVQPI